MLGRRCSVAIAAVAALCCLALAAPSSVGVAVQRPSLAATIATATATAVAVTSGSSSSPGDTVRTSLVDGTGTQAPGGVGGPVISGNGRWQVFSSSDALQPSSPGSQAGNGNIFVRDLVNDTTTQLTVGNSAPADGSGTPQIPDSSSSSPSITDDGRYVSFITQATNIVPADPLSVTLVVCDRDPDSDGIFDELNANGTGSLTNVCKSVYSTNVEAANAISASDTPQLAGFGGRVVWTEFNGSSATTKVWTASLNDSNGDLNPGTPLLVQNKITSPAGCGTQPSGTDSNERQPVIADNSGEIFFTAEYPWGSFCTAIVGTFNFAVPNNERSERFDVIPTGCGTGFLGDDDTLSGPCAGGGGGGDVFVSRPMIDEFGSQVLFRFHNGPSPLSFAGPRAAAAPNTDTDWMVLAQATFSGTTTQVISRDNAGGLINSALGALSEDGRYVAFGTSDPDAHDGQDVAGEQIVARDLSVDAQRARDGLPRQKGALVTPSVTPTCKPDPPAGVSCASAGGRVGSITLDDSGARVSFTTIAADVATPAATGAVPQAYVRTWQPTLATGTADLGDIQAGSSTVFQIPVRVTTFGPVQFGPVTIGGPSAAEFAIEGNNCTGSRVFHVGETCSIAIRFAPDADTLGNRSATVSVDSDVYPAPQLVSSVQARVVPEGPTTSPGDNTRTSVTSGGGQSSSGGDASMVSGNGRWQVFVSGSNLTGRTAVDPLDNTLAKIFVRDLADPEKTVQLGLHTDVGAKPAPAVPHPVAVSGHPHGASANGPSFQPSISSNGRFVSFFTEATDIVRFPALQSDTPDIVLVVCDRDPTGAKDAAGNPVLDLPRTGTQVPNYECFPVQSGVRFGTDDVGVTTGSTPHLAGNGTRITWVENQDFSEDRVRVATLSSPGGKLHAPDNFGYAPSDVAGFSDSATRVQGEAEQDDPTLTENGSAVVYDAGGCNSSSCRSGAIIETDLVSGDSVRLDIVNGDEPLGNGGGRFDPPAVSDDGNRVAFAFAAPNAEFSQVYVVTQTGSAPQTVIASHDNADNPAAGNTPALSGDGRYLAFRTSQPNEHNGVDPPNGSCFTGSSTTTHVFCQIVARDLVKDAARAAADLPRVPSEIVSSSIATTCVKKLPPGRLCAGDGTSSNPSIDATGSEIGFDSDADDIVTGDTNVNDDGEGSTFPATDSFVHTWRPTLSASTFAFGSVPLGGHKDKSMTLTESGFGPISLGSTVISGTNPADYKVRSTTCTGKTLNDTEQCTIKVRFSPAHSGNRKATLATPVGQNGYPRHNPQNTISYDPALLRTLTGFGSSSQVAIAPTTVNFGNQLPERQPGTAKTVSVTNTGTQPLLVTGAVVNDTTVPGAHGDYTVDVSGCTGNIPTGGSCAIVVTFVGHAVGRRDAVLVITVNSSGGPQTVTLQANVPKPKTIVNPGVSPAGRVVMVTGTGFAPNRFVDVGTDAGGEHAQVKADAHGAFSGGLVLFSNGMLGPRNVTARSHGVSATIAATCPLLVVLGSLDSPGLVIRH